MQLSPSLFGFSLLSAYNLAACLMEDLTLFKAWTLTTHAAELQHMQTLTGMRVFWLYIPAKTVMTFWAPFLVAEEPLLWWCVASMGVSWGSSFLVQVPLQLEVRRTGDRVAVERLARTTKVRTVSIVVHAVAVGLVLYWKL